MLGQTTSFRHGAWGTDRIRSARQRDPQPTPLAMLRYKVGMIVTLGVAAGVGVVYYLLVVG